MLIQPKSQTFPRLRTLVQKLYSSPLTEAQVEARVAEEFRRLGLGARLGPGKTVALGAGSRGVANIALVLRALVREVRSLGADAFLFPAMGSHGGATPEGQKEMLETLGVTEDYVGCPIRSSLDVAEIGRTPRGVPVYLDRHAYGADAIIVTNRVKPHTNFRAHVESGLMKMLAIGAGKHKQALALHSYGVPGLAEHMPEVARVVLASGKIAAGFALLEDAYHRTSKVAAFAPAELEAGEAALLAEAKRILPKLPVKELDLLIVDEMGKNISGTGMDTNVVGRVRQPDFVAFPEPVIKCILACDLTPESHGNALGMGLADMVTRRLADQVDFRKTYVNSITGGDPQRGSLPLVINSPREAVRIALDCLIGPVAPERARIIRIKNTLELGEMRISGAVAEEVLGREGVELRGEWEDMAFGPDGNFI